MCSDICSVHANDSQSKKKKEKGEAPGPSCLHTISFLFGNKRHWVIKEDDVKDVLKLPQLWTWFKAAETEICFTQAVAVWEFRLTKLGSFSWLTLPATGTAGTAASLREPRPVQHTIIQTQRHLASENTQLNTTLIIHRLALPSFASTPPAFSVIKKLLLDPSYCLQLSLRCFLQHFMPQDGWLWTGLFISP